MITRRSRAAALFAIGLVLAVGAPALPAAGQPATTEPEPATPETLPVVAAVPLPAGWALDPGTDGLVLAYAPTQPLPVRDARTEFRLDGEVLGYPVQRGGRLELVLTTPPAGDLATLEVWVGTTRIDGPTTPARAPQPAAPASSPPPSAPLGTVDPATPGSYRTERLSYNLREVAIAGLSIKSEVTAEVIAPTDAPGKRPVVLFLHGRHTTCYDPDDPGFFGLDWPCPAPTKSIPSYQGYRYVAEILASQGYVTVSISANAVNAFDALEDDAGMLARSELVRHHLGLWTRWSKQSTGPFGSRFVGRLDLSKVVLVGHSRGGEGVERAAIDAAATGAPYTITGLALIGPTDFGRQVAAGAHTATILPYCDGDVSDLQGQGYIDDARDLLGGAADPALHSAVLVLGTNHNFYNTEWTPGQAVAPSFDDWGFGGSDDDPDCGANGGQRLTPVEQQAAGAVYIAALTRLAASADQAMLPYLDGAWVFAPSAGRAVVYTHAIGGNHRTLLRAEDGLTVATQRAEATTCDGYGANPFEPTGSCAGFSASSPHWLNPWTAPSLPASKAVRIAWGDKGSARFTLRKVADLRGASHLDARVAMQPGSNPAELRIVFTDASGTSKSLRPELSALPPLPGPVSSDPNNPFFGPIPKIWAYTLRVDLAQLPTSLRAAVASIALFSNNGGATSYLLDMSTRFPRVAAPTIEPLARISVEHTTVEEGDRPRTERIRLTIDGTVRRAAKVWLHVGDPNGAATGREVVIRPGVRTIDVPIKVQGDDVYSGDTDYYVSLIARANIATGRYLGTLTVTEDDTPPVFRVTPLAVDVAEGQPWAWRVDSNQPVTFAAISLSFVTPTSGPEATVDDLSASQRFQFGIEDPGLDAFALSAAPSGFYVGEIPWGTTSVIVQVETGIDGKVERPERAGARVAPFTGTGEFTGDLIVRDA